MVPGCFNFSIVTEFCSHLVIKITTLIIFFLFFSCKVVYPAEPSYSIKCLHVVSFLKCRGKEWCFVVFFFSSKSVFANFFSGEECSIRWLSLVLFPSKPKPDESISLNGVSHVQLNIQHSVSTSVSCG